MNAPQPRRFTTTETLVLATALFLGVAWMLEARTLLVSWSTSDSLLGPLAPKGVVVLRRFLHPLAALITPVTFAVCILQLRQPGRSLASCLRSPGVSACAVAAVVLIFELLNCFLDLPTRFADDLMRTSLPNAYANFRPLDGKTLLNSIAFSIGEAPGLAVAGAYLALASTGLWQRDSKGIERLGSALGWCWIVIAVAFILLPPWPT